MPRNIYMPWPQRVVPLALLLLTASFAQDPASPQQSVTEPDLNVNSKYIVEAVEFRYIKKPTVTPKQVLEIQRTANLEVGKRFVQERFDGLVKRLKTEYRTYKVTHRMEKGTQPDHVKIIFELERDGFELNANTNDLKLLYHSKNNFSFGTTLEISTGGEGAIIAGFLTDNDLTLERTSGIRGGYRHDLARRRVRLAVVGESFRAQWNPATQSDPGLYRRRQSLEPSVTVQVLPSLRLKAGVNLQRIETQFPVARFESSHALISSLRYEQGWDLGTTTRNLVVAGYDLRAAARTLGSDFVYARHTFEVGQNLTLPRKQAIALSFTGGTLGGQAPLFERFVLGNSQTLRGYNRFEVAPFGGNRMAHGTAEYGIRGLRILYDRGAVWTGGQTPKVRQSLGAGVTKAGLTCMVAFPLRDGQMMPILLLGYNF